MRVLYFDCFAGASGNMILGGLAALGIDAGALIGEIGKLNIPEFDIEFSNAERSGLMSVHARTVFNEETKHRRLSDILQIIESSDLSATVKGRSTEIFKNLARAEAKVHGVDIGKVHFHEVGAMDAIIDVVGACVGFELLRIDKFVCSKIHVGSGFVKMAHGKFPVPPPAVSELLLNIPIYSTEIEGELITPTGAAVISTVCTEFGPIPEMKINATGYGAGTREYDVFPNVLRLMLGESAGPQADEENRFAETDLLLLESNIDDMTPQILGFVMDRAFDAGCLDCWFTPIQMKKNRPATMLSVICHSDKKNDLLAMLYSETTTIGVRISQIERECLERRIVTVKTEFGEIDVKIAKSNGKIMNAKPEFEHLKKISLERALPMRKVERAIMNELESHELT